MANKTSSIKGKIQITKKGFGFLLPENKKLQDVFIAEKNLSGALDGDEVAIEMLTRRGFDSRKEGRVLSILKRANVQFVGKLQLHPQPGIVPENQRGLDWIQISGKLAPQIKKDDKVVVEIEHWGKRDAAPIGRIVEHLGAADDPQVDLKTVIITNHIPFEFDGEAQAYAEKSAKAVQVSAAGRLDLRDELIFTVDGADAKDLDDAVSIEKTETGYILGVHIADVSQYVAADSALDKAAYVRGTSVYLPGLVVPMLPAVLSNGVCSLNPKVDRLTLSAFLTFDLQGNLVDSRFAKSIISSKVRMTYDDVFAIMQADDKTCAKYGFLVEPLRHMADLMRKLRALRHARGSIDFITHEPEFNFDEKGFPIVLKAHEINEAHMLIEEFMIACNETVSQFLAQSVQKNIYRVHDKPSADKITPLLQFALRRGYRITAKANNIGNAVLQKLLQDVADKPEATAISKIMLRCMQKAVYSEENIGHYGLGSQSYCHFTSPIRRYPDLIVHRLLKAAIAQQPTKTTASRLREIAQNCTQAEIRAVTAEREADKIRQVQYMTRHVGEEFTGIISGVVFGGLFVELPNTAEGFIDVQDMKDDYYRYDEAEFCLAGRRNGNIYRLGDVIKVVLQKADIDAVRLSFTLVT